MKKRLVAIVALAAMLLSLLPAAAFAADTSKDINITVASFNNNIERKRACSDHRQ